MANFYTDNKDLQFTLENLDLAEAVAIKEENYTKAEKFESAPVDYADALDNFIRVAKVAGEIAGNPVHRQYFG